MKRLVLLAGAVVLSATSFAGKFVGNWGDWVSPAGSWLGQSVKTNKYLGSAIRFETKRQSYTAGDDTLLPALGGGGFITFCTEFGEFISTGQKTHDRVELLTGNAAQTTWAGGSAGTVSFNATRVSQLERLWYQILNTSTWNNQTAAAFQLAQWEISFDDGLSLTSGVGAGLFYNTGSLAATVVQAQGYLNAANNLSTGRAAVYLMSDSLSELPGSGNLVQDQITGRLDRPPGGNSVPEPLTMGLGLAAAGVFVRRRVKAKTL